MTGFENRYEQMLHEMEELVKLTNKRSVLILLQHTHPTDLVPCVPAVRESITNIIGFVSLGDEQYLPYIIKRAADVVDTIMIDVDVKRGNSEQIRDTATRLAVENGIAVAYYSDYSAWTSSAIAFMIEIEQQQKKTVGFGERRLLIGRNALATKMIFELINRGMDVYILREEYSSSSLPTAGGEIEIRSSFIHLVEDFSETSFDALIGCELQRNSPYLDKLSTVAFGLIYDVGINNFTQDFIHAQRTRGAQVYRSDDRAGISGMVVNLMETRDLVGSRLGRTHIGGIPVVSGGYVGENGDVVVDNFNDAHSVLGVANGDGTFKLTLSDENETNMNRIMNLI